MTRLFATSRSTASLLFLTLAALALASTSHSAVSAYWRFEEGGGAIAQDVSGNLNHAELMGDTSFQPDVPRTTIPLTGTSNTYSIYVDGDFDALRIPDSPSLRPTDGLTIEAWIKPEEGGWVIIGKQLYGGWVNSYGFEVNQNWGGFLRFVLTDPDGTEHDVWDWSAPFPIGSWRHVAATWDREEIVMYVDGDSVAASPYTGEIGYDDHAVLVGADNDGAGEPGCCFFKGWMDEIRISDVALPPAEFLNAGSPEGVGQVADGSSSLEILRVSPNPAARELTVDYTVAGCRPVEFVLLDLQGRRVTSCAVYPALPGSQRTAWTLPRDVAGGLYFLQIADGSARVSRKVLIVH